MYKKEHIENKFYNSGSQTFITTEPLRLSNRTLRFCGTHFEKRSITLIYDGSSDNTD